MYAWSIYITIVPILSTRAKFHSGSKYQIFQAWQFLSLFGVKKKHVQGHRPDSSGNILDGIWPALPPRFWHSISALTVTKRQLGSHRRLFAGWKRRSLWLRVCGKQAE